MKILDYLVYFFFGTALAYCLFQVFITWQPPGLSGPLFLSANHLDPQIIIVRRLYAIEGWLCGSGLVIYIAIRNFAKKSYQIRMEKIND
jgi:hypothetical protein